MSKNERFRPNYELDINRFNQLLDPAVQMHEAEITYNPPRLSEENLQNLEIEKVEIPEVFVPVEPQWDDVSESELGKKFTDIDWVESVEQARESDRHDCETLRLLTNHKLVKFLKINIFKSEQALVSYYQTLYQNGKRSKKDVLGTLNKKNLAIIHEGLSEIAIGKYLGRRFRQIEAFRRSSAGNIPPETRS